MRRPAPVTDTFFASRACPPTRASTAHSEDYVVRVLTTRPGGGGGRESMLAAYVPLASQSPYPIIVYSEANYRPHLSHFCVNVNFAIPT